MKVITLWGIETLSNDWIIHHYVTPTSDLYVYMGLIEEQYHKSLCNFSYVSIYYIWLAHTYYATGENKQTNKQKPPTQASKILIDELGLNEIEFIRSYYYYMLYFISIISPSIYVSGSILWVAILYYMHRLSSEH